MNVYFVFELIREFFHPTKGYILNSYLPFILTLLLSKKEKKLKDFIYHFNSTGKN